LGGPDRIVFNDIKRTLRSIPPESRLPRRPRITKRSVNIALLTGFIPTPARPIQQNCGGIAGATEGNGSDVTFATRQYFRTHHCGVWTEAFDWLAGSQTVIGRDEEQSDGGGDFRHIDPGLWMHVDNSFQVDRAQ
jgi:hypothetical protein